MKPALLIIDMLVDFVHEDGALHVPGAQDAIPVIRKVHDTLRERGVPILYLCDAHSLDDPEMADWPPHAIQGTKGAEIVSSLEPSPDDLVIQKTHIRGFDEPEVAEKIEELEADYLIITGVATEHCVKETALQARKRGLAVTIVSDGIAGVERNTGDIERAVEDLRLAGAQFLSSKELLGDLEGRVHAA
ncbi:MAG: isochorismatase family cysteine hydrolase [Desulfocurvibacter africanus]